MKYTILILLLFLIASPAQEFDYPWKPSGGADQNLKVIDIPVPAKFNRAQVENNSFGQWLRFLPLRDKDAKVRLYNGEDKYNQSLHYRILNIDTGNKNLQQCADAIIRLRAEYLYHFKWIEKIHFNFTSGDTAKFTEWINGYRPNVINNRVTWEKKQIYSNSYTNFRKYLETVFAYAGSYSLKKELVKVTDLSKIQIGDLFIQAGFPGHALLVIDLARSTINSDLAVLLAQSYMPAQDIHILKNLADAKISPWFLLGKGEYLDTPEWTFNWTDLYRFKGY